MTFEICLEKISNNTKKKKMGLLREAAVSNVIKLGMSIVGVSTPEKM